MYKLPLNINMNNIEVLKALSNANYKIGELQGIMKILPNPEIFLNAVYLIESKESSEIENVITTYDEIYQTITTNIDSINGKEVLRYKDTLMKGYELVKKNNFISMNNLVEIHSMLETNSAGIRSTMGTVIKNTKTGEIVHTPPQQKSEILDYLTNLETYINNENQYDPLVNLAIIHYQFESIHPFYDGNGRLGRILNVLYLVLKDKLSYPIIYMSKYILKSKQEYYELLKAISTDETKIIDFTIYMLNIISKSITDTIEFINRFLASFEETLQSIKEELPTIYSHELVELLYKDFYITNEEYRNTLKVSRPTATKQLNILEELGYIESIKIGKQIYYKNLGLFNLLNT